jgi:anti-anti-sigma regulatory factor
VRAHGDLDGADRAAGRDHVCWVYSGDESFAEAARAYLHAGLTRGDRLLWVGDDFPGRVGLPGADALAARGALQLLPRASSYEARPRFTRTEQYAFYDAAVREARDHGYTGLCVVAEVTATAADPGGRAEFVRWEHLADRFIAESGGLTAMCLYEAGGLPAETLAELTAVHAWTRAPGSEPPFRLWFDGSRLCLAGSVDTFSAARLAAVLEATPTDGGAVVLDLSELEFADAAGTRVLAGWARQLADHTLRLTVVGAPHIFRRIWQLLAVDVPGVTFAG